MPHSIKIYPTTPDTPIPLPRAAFMVQRYSKRAIGGCKEAVIKVAADAAILASLRNTINYGIHIFNSQGALVWWGYIEDISTSAIESTGTMTCAGWWKKLSTRYYAQPKGMYAFMDTSADKQAFSEGANIELVAQAIYNPSPSDAWDVSAIGVNLYMVGDRNSDSVNLSIMTDSGTPIGDYSYPTSTTVAYWTTSPTGATIGKNGGYFQYDLNTTFSFTNTIRWIKLTATGPYNIANYFQCGVNTKKIYDQGKLRWYKDVDWHSGTSNGPAGNGPDGSMLFKLIGSLPTTTQITNVINATGDYSGIDVMSASGVSSCQYREGKEKADAIIEDLLKTGNTSGTRYLIDVSPYKRVRIYAEPTAAIGDYFRLTGATKIGYSIANLANKVSAIYTTQKGASTSGSQAQTDWQENATSQTRYGIREQIISLKDTDETAADNYVTTALNLMAWPETKVEWDFGSKVRIYSPYGGIVRNDTCPVGYWARVTDSVQSYLESPFIKAASVVFVEEAEYDADGDAYTPTPRGSAPDWQLFTFSG
jgi:hypothetical protein